MLPHGRSGMRRIDLTCLILAPIGVGFLMTYAGARAAIVATLAWNLIAWRPECLLASHAVLCSDALQCAQPALGCTVHAGFPGVHWRVCCQARCRLPRHRLLMRGWQERLWPSACRHRCWLAVISLAVPGTGKGYPKQLQEVSVGQQ